MKTTISNEFTGYNATIRHKEDLPALSTVKKHLRASKASDCQSVTMITQRDGERTIRLDIVDTGNGDELMYIG